MGKSEKRLRELNSKNLNPADFISGAAANSFVDNNADINCLRQLGANAYRFSVDWSRIERRPGQFDQAALDYYLDLVKKLRASGIEPMVTLWHWPLPLWVRDLGGWQSPKIIAPFLSFCEKIGRYLNAEVNFWITENEPLVYANMSFLKGVWPPQKKSRLAFLIVMKNLIAAHRQVYDVLKGIDPNNRVGIAKNNIYFEASGNKLINRLLKKGSDWWWNKRFLNRIADKQDFIGLNYYFHNLINYRFGGNFTYEKYSDMLWGLHPEGIFYLLKDLQRFGKPIYITENGLADKGDQHRSWYINQILKNVHRAITEGVNVRGYFHWSLVDNFEWADGFDPNFGLFELNRQTFERIPRSSAEFYEDICRHNRIVV